MSYRTEAEARSLDSILARLSLEARQLLWLIVQALEKETLAAVRSVWRGEDLWFAAAYGELHAHALIGIETDEVVFRELVYERVQTWMDEHPADRDGRTVEDVWLDYGAYHSARFHKPASGQEAFEAGRRALVYHVRAHAYEDLGGFAWGLVNSTRDPVRLRQVVAELETAAKHAPAGPARWRVRAYLADALNQAGQPARALDRYEQAAAEAEAAGDWADLAWITGNWADVLRDVGRLDAARDMFLRSAEKYKAAGDFAADVLCNELLVLHIDVMRGAAASALPEIEARLAEARALAAGEGPDVEFLGQLLVTGLDIARQANLALERWQTCLDILDEIEERTRGEGEYARARVRFNRYYPLLLLGRLDEVQRVLDGCSQVFHEAGDIDARGKTLGAFADLAAERGDLGQALDLDRQALAITNDLPDPEARAASHGNLADHLRRAGHLADASAHRLAAVTYRLISGHRQRPRDLALPLALPRVAELLARPDFDALARFLASRGADPAALQADVDALTSAVVGMPRE